MTTEVSVTNIGGSSALASGLQYTTVDWEKTIDDFGEATVHIPAQCVPESLKGAHPYAHELRVDVDNELAFVGPLRFVAQPLHRNADLILYARDLAYWFALRYTRISRSYVDTPVTQILREVANGALSVDDPNLREFITFHNIVTTHDREIESVYDNAWDDHMKSIVGKLAHMRVHGRSIDFWRYGQCLGELPRVRADQFDNFDNLVFDGEEYGTHATVFGADAVDAVEADPDIPGDTGTPAVPRVIGVSAAPRTSLLRNVRVERTLRDDTYLDIPSAYTASQSLLRPRAPLGFADTDQFLAQTSCDTPWPITRVAPGMCVPLGTPLGEISMQVRTVSGSVNADGVETFSIGFEEPTSYPDDYVAPIVVAPPTPGVKNAPIITSRSYVVGSDPEVQTSYAYDDGLMLNDASNTMFAWGYEYNTTTFVTTNGVVAVRTVGGIVSTAGFLDVPGAQTNRQVGKPAMVSATHLAVIPADPDTGAGVFDRYLRIFDVSNPASMSEVSKLSSLPIPSTAGEVHYVALGSTLHVFTTSGSSYVIDCSNPASPVLTQTDSPNPRRHTLQTPEVRGGKAWITNQALSGATGLAKVDLASRVIEQNYTVNGYVQGPCMNLDGTALAYIGPSDGQIIVIATANGAILYDEITGLPGFNNQLRTTPSGDGFIEVSGSSLGRRFVFADAAWSTISTILNTNQSDGGLNETDAGPSDVSANGVFYTYSAQDDPFVEGIASWFVEG